MLVPVLLTLAIQTTTFDTTLAVRSDTRLDVSVSAGSIEVKVWDRSAVQIVGRSERGAMVTAELDGLVLRVRARAATSAIDLVDYEITVPRRMNLTLGRGDVDIAVRGTEGSVDASITSGSISVEGGRGSLALRSFQGTLQVRGARASVTAESTTGAIGLYDVVGDVAVSSNSNHLTLDDVDSRNLRARTIAGVIRFRGPVHREGRYEISTHSGSIFFRSPIPINATVAVATVGGAFSSGLPYTITERQRQNIFTARFGNGGARVSLETFNGGIVVEGLKPM